MRQRRLSSNPGVSSALSQALVFVQGAQIFGGSEAPVRPAIATLSVALVPGTAAFLDSGRRRGRERPRMSSTLC